MLIHPAGDSYFLVAFPHVGVNELYRHGPSEKIFGSGDHHPPPNIVLINSPIGPDGVIPALEKHNLAVMRIGPQTRALRMVEKCYFRIELLPMSILMIPWMQRASINGCVDAAVAFIDTNALIYICRNYRNLTFQGNQMELVETKKQFLEDRILSRVQPLIDRMYQLEKEGVRRSLREDLIHQALDGTLSDPFPIRRAKAFSYLLDHTELVIHDHETVLGSLMGLFPLREEQLSGEEIYLEGKAHILEGMEKGNLADENRKTAQLEFNYMGPRVSYQDLKAVAQKISEEMSGESDLTFTRVFSALEGHFCDSPQAIALNRLAMRADGSLKSTPEEPLWTMAHHLASDYEKVLKLGFGGIRDEAVSKMAGTGDEAKRVF